METIVKPLGDFHFALDRRTHITHIACEWERNEYGEGKHRMAHVLLDCLAKTDTSFICAMNGGEFVGYADLWQLKSEFYKLLISGESHEEEIAHEYIVGPGDKPSACWYVGSIIIEPALRDDNPVKSAQIFQRISQELYAILLSAPYPARVMGVGSTIFGNKLLAKHGFKRITPSSKASDTRPRFEKVLEALTLAPQ